MNVSQHWYCGRRLPNLTEDTPSTKVIFQRLKDKVFYTRECTMTKKEWTITWPCFFSGRILLFHGSFWHLQAFFYAFLHILSGLPLLFYKTQANQELQQDYRNLYSNTMTFNGGVRGFINVLVANNNADTCS